MRLLTIIALSIAGYGVTLWLLDHVFGVPSESQLYWLCFFSSGLILFAGLLVGFRRQPFRLGVVAPAILVSLLLVICGDLALAVAYSCAQGVCL
jgi:hypothetical protein